jgi:hypothetical protein
MADEPAGDDATTSTARRGRPAIAKVPSGAVNA